MKIKLKNIDLKDPSEKKEYNLELFDVVAPKYDAVTKILSFGRDKSWKKALIKMLPSGLKRPKCLDIASGTGDIAFLLAGKYPDAKITGLDLNSTMLAIASRKNRSKNINFITGDMNVIPEKAGSFDIITGGYALRNAPDLAVTLKEIHRVMKPGGTCAFLDFSRPGNKLSSALHLFFLGLWGKIWGSLLHGRSEVYGYIAETLERYPDRDALRALLKKTGFKNIHTKILFFGFTDITRFSK